MSNHFVFYLSRACYDFILDYLTFPDLVFHISDELSATLEDSTFITSLKHQLHCKQVKDFQNLFDLSDAKLVPVIIKTAKIDHHLIFLFSGKVAPLFLF